ncbi:MAG: hypothetical protein GY708_24535 [Actinomycetia bacterium]|nr:hypothetical protein [Actinomycetes bacterium]
MTEAVPPEPDSRLGNAAWADNWTLGHGLRFELIEAVTQRVFICQDEVTAGELAAFEPPEGFGHALAGEARADMAFFERSPGSDTDGPVETAELGGLRFSFVARPVGLERLASGAVEMSIDKHHAMLYRSGRTIDVLDFGDGTVATPAWGSRDPEVVPTDSQLEAGWQLRRVQLVDDLLTYIPNPARVIVLDRAFGFHGPVSEDIVSAVAQEAAR